MVVIGIGEGKVWYLNFQATAVLYLQLLTTAVLSNLDFV